jgi:hypothetical protein
MGWNEGFEFERARTQIAPQGSRPEALEGARGQGWANDAYRQIDPIAVDRVTRQVDTSAPSITDWPQERAMDVPTELQERANRAEALALDPKLLALAWSPGIIGSRYAMRDGNALLKENGIEVPDGLTVRFRASDELSQPGPDWYPYTVRMFMCRKYWLQRPGEKPEEVSICWGFEIVETRPPGGPIG